MFEYNRIKKLMSIREIRRWIMKHQKAKANNHCEHEQWYSILKSIMQMPVNMISNIVAIDINFGQDNNSIWSSTMNDECVNIESTWLYLIIKQLSEYIAMSTLLYMITWKYDVSYSSRESLRSPFQIWRNDISEYPRIDDGTLDFIWVLWLVEKYCKLTIAWYPSSYPAESY